MVYIDVHHHYFPASLQKHKASPAMGWRTPAENLPWTPEISIQSMDRMGVTTAILSLPALASGEISHENRALARERNVYASQICQNHPKRFGFFACLPYLDDVDGALAEIAYGLDELHADGISLSSSYGEGASAGEFCASIRESREGTWGQCTLGMTATTLSGRSSTVDKL